VAGKQRPAKRPEPRDGFVAVGRIVRAHGVRGELVVEALTDFPERYDPGAVLSAGGRSYRVAAVRPHRGALLLTLDGIVTRPAAEAMRGLLLEVPEADLAPLGEDRYYRHQLAGLAVVDTEGNALGRIEEVLETGANDVYLVRGERGELLLPAIDTVVKAVDIKAGRMVVQLMPGLEYKPPKAPRH